MEKRIVKIYSEEGKKFYIYYDGTTHYDEVKGKPVRVPSFCYLDEDFSKLLRVSKKEYVNQEAKLLKSKGLNVVVGPTIPEIETVDGDFIPNNDKTTLGIWELATDLEKEKYNLLITRQEAEKAMSSNNKKLI